MEFLLNLLLGPHKVEDCFKQHLCSHSKQLQQVDSLASNSLISFPLVEAYSVQVLSKRLNLDPFPNPSNKHKACFLPNLYFKLKFQISKGPTVPLSGGSKLHKWELTMSPLFLGAIIKLLNQSTTQLTISIWTSLALLYVIQSALSHGIYSNHKYWLCRLGKEVFVFTKLSRACKTRINRC